MIDKVQLLSLTTISIFLWVCFHSFPLEGANISWLLWLLLRTGGALFITYQKHKAINSWGLLFFIFALLIALPNALYTQNTLIYFQYPISLLCILIGTLIIASENKKPRWEIWFIETWIESIIMSITGMWNYYSELKNQKILSKDNSYTIILLQILKGILIWAPILIIITILLANADKMFADIIYKIYPTISWWTIRDIFIVLLVTTVIVSYYTYVFFIQKYEKIEQRKIWDASHSVSIISFLSALVIILWLYSVIQMKYLLLWGELPTGYIYADYAKEWFRQLIAATCIILSTYLGIKNLFTKTRTINTLLTIIILNNGFLLYTALYRFSAYIEAYNFTFMRLLPLSFMIMIWVLIAIGLLQSFYKKLTIRKRYIITILSRFSIIGIVNLDILSVKRNIQRYYETNKIDMEYIISNISDKCDWGIEIENCEIRWYEILPYLIQLEKYMEKQWTGESLKSLQTHVNWLSQSKYESKYTLWSRSLLEYNFSKNY